MIKSQKKLKDFALVLGKDNPVLIAEAVEMLRDEEPFEGAVGLLASCYEKNHSTLVRKAVENFFNDLKDKELRPEIVTEIKRDRSSETISMLVSSCWQSGMDYTDFAGDFAEIFLKGDYGTAIECFTVIEGVIPELDRMKRKEITTLIRGNMESAGAKKALCLELISLLGT
jgi:predicted DNA-binding protein